MSDLRCTALRGQLLTFLDRVRDDLVERIRHDADARRTWQLADLLIACLRGLVSGGSSGLEI